MAPLRARLPQPLGPGGDHGPESAGRAVVPRGARLRLSAPPSPPRPAGGRDGRRSSLDRGAGRPVGGRKSRPRSSAERAGPRPRLSPAGGRRSSPSRVGPRLRLSPPAPVPARPGGGRETRRSSSGRAGPRAGGRVPRRSSSARGVLRPRLSPEVKARAPGVRSSGRPWPRGRLSPESPGRGGRRSSPPVRAGPRPAPAGGREPERRVPSPPADDLPVGRADDPGRRSTPDPDPPARVAGGRPLPAARGDRSVPGWGRFRGSSSGGGRRVTMVCRLPAVPSNPEREKGSPFGEPSSKKFRRRPTLPGGLPPSTIGAGGLNFRVRHGNGCDSTAIATGNLLSTGSLPRT